MRTKYGNEGASRQALVGQGVVFTDPAQTDAMGYAPPRRGLIFSPGTVWHRLNQEAQMRVCIGLDLHVRTQTVVLA